MQFLNSFYLIGLVGLLVPIIIHLWSKNSREVIPFGSLLFLSETETKTLKSLMPSEWLLLILRMILIALLALIMTDMVYQREESSRDTTYLIDPLYKNEVWLADFLDTIPTDNAKWLTNDFPNIRDSSGLHVTTNYWQLLSEFNQVEASELVVVSPLLQKNFKGQLTHANQHIKWLSPKSFQESQELISIKKGGVNALIVGEYNEKLTSYHHESGSDGDSSVISIYIKSNEQFLQQHQLLKASIKAIDQNSLITYRITADSLAADWVFWMSNQTFKIRKNMVFFGIPNSELLSPTSKHTYSLNPDLLTVENALSGTFLFGLEEMISPDFNEAEYDLRQIPVETLQATSMAIENKSNEAQWASGKSILWILFLFIFITERIISQKMSNG